MRNAFSAYYREREKKGVKSDGNRKLEKKESLRGGARREGNGEE